MSRTYYKYFALSLFCDFALNRRRSCTADNTFNFNNSIWDGLFDFVYGPALQRICRRSCVHARFDSAQYYYFPFCNIRLRYFAYNTILLVTTICYVFLSRVYYYSIVDNIDQHILILSLLFCVFVLHGGGSCTRVNKIR